MSSQKGNTQKSSSSAASHGSGSEYNIYPHVVGAGLVGIVKEGTKNEVRNHPPTQGNCKAAVDGCNNNVKNSSPIQVGKIEDFCKKKAKDKQCISGQGVSCEDSSKFLIFPQIDGAGMVGVVNKDSNVDSRDVKVVVEGNKGGEYTDRGHKYYISPHVAGAGIVGVVNRGSNYVKDHSGKGYCADILGKINGGDNTTKKPPGEGEASELKQSSSEHKISPQCVGACMVGEVNGGINTVVVSRPPKDESSLDSTPVRSAGVDSLDTRGSNYHICPHIAGAGLVGVVNGEKNTVVNLASM